MPTLKHDPADRCTCSYCGIAEDIHLLDGVLDERGNDTGKLACIACYPEEDSWCPTGEKHIRISIAPSLLPFYEHYLAKEAAKRKALRIHERGDQLFGIVKAFVNPVMEHHGIPVRLCMQSLRSDAKKLIEEIES